MIRRRESSSRLLLIFLSICKIRAFRRKKAHGNCHELFEDLNINDQRIPLSYGMPSAFGALEFLEVKARMIREMIYGIML